MNIEERLFKLHRDKPEYIAILKVCCEAHRRVEQRAIEVAKKYGYSDTSWLGFEHTDIKLDTDDFKLAVSIPRRLHILANLAFLEVSFKSNNSTNYRVMDIEELERILARIEQLQHEPTFDKEVEIPEDIFSIIAGYEDIKSLFKQALRVERFHILLLGPPASAKSIFLLELARIPGSFYCLGSATTKAGIAEILYEQRPRILLADELDKFENKDIAILLSLAETGIVRETKVSKQREVTLNTSIFAAANSEKWMPQELLSRFRVLYLPEYTQIQFLEAATKVLVKRGNVNVYLASYIAGRTWEISRDIREVVRIGKICHTEEEVDADIELLLRYGRQD